jgi:hypothetical protein
MCINVYVVKYHDMYILSMCVNVYIAYYHDADKVLLCLDKDTSDGEQLVLLKMLRRARRSLDYWRGVGRLQIPNHPC